MLQYENAARASMKEADDSLAQRVELRNRISELEKELQSTVHSLQLAQRDSTNHV